METIETELRCKGVLDALEVSERPDPSTDEGWGQDICRQCETEITLEELALDEAWQHHDPHLDEDV